MDDYNADYTTMQQIAFSDGRARVIDHIYVTNIAYVLNALVYGDGWNPTANDTTRYEIVAMGLDANGNELSRTTFALCNGKDSVVTTWQKWDLSVLGEVNALAFNMVGTADRYGQWGLNTPAYFAYDDVAVRFSKDETALPTIQSPMTTCRKVLHNGQVLILRDGTLYTLTGQAATNK